MLISLLVCRAFFLLAIVLLIAICTMLIGIHFHEYYYPMNHFQTLAYLEIFYYSPLFILLKKYWTLLLFLHILFNTLAHLPTPFPSPMSIDEYFEITLKSPSVSKTWKTVFTVEISFSFLAEKCKQIIRIYAKWEQIQIRAQVHWKVVSSARFSRQVGFKINRKKISLGWNYIFHIHDFEVYCHFLTKCLIHLIFVQIWEKVFFTHLYTW